MELTCKGSWALGTACGQCGKCATEARTYITQLQTALQDARERLQQVYTLSHVSEPARQDALLQIRRLSTLIKLGQLRPEI